MKKVFSLMLLLATLMVFLPACSDDKDEPDDIKSNMNYTRNPRKVGCEGISIKVGYEF